MKYPVTLLALPLILCAGYARETAAPPPAAVPAGADAVRRIELPIETGIYRPGPGMDLANTFCLSCHSVEYCQSQPPLPEKYWDGTVKKMKEKFGATLPDEAIAPLVKYLTAAYGKPGSGK